MLSPFDQLTYRGFLHRRPTPHSSQTASFPAPHEAKNGPGCSTRIKRLVEPMGRPRQQTGAYRWSHAHIGTKTEKLLSAEGGSVTLRLLLTHHTSPQLKEKKKCEGREQVGRETDEDGFHIVTDADEFISTSSRFRSLLFVKENNNKKQKKNQTQVFLSPFLPGGVRVEAMFLNLAVAPVNWPVRGSLVTSRLEV